jgi:hypothetical protein
MCWIRHWTLPEPGILQGSERIDKPFAKELIQCRGTLLRDRPCPYDQTLFSGKGDIFHLH